MASRKTMNLLHCKTCAVLYQRTATAIEMASKVGAFFIDVLFAVTLAVARAIREEVAAD